MSDRPRLRLPQVTLCAVTSVNVAATLAAMEACLQQADFGACTLLTDAEIASHHPAIEIVRIDRLASGAAYSDFLLNRLVDHVATSHCLVVQWDGHVLDAGRWQPAFLDHDYVGASWPQFDDGMDVGNGGFSLRSRRLMDACRKPGFVARHPEDIAIGRDNRRFLEERGMRFADMALADAFSTERTGTITRTFGYHGVWNMPEALGVERFWSIYRTLDDRGTLQRDFTKLLRDVARGKGGYSRVATMILDRLRDAFSRR